MRKSVITAMLAGVTVLALTGCTPYDQPSNQPSTADLPTGVAPVHSTSAKPTSPAPGQAAAGGHNDADVNFAQHLYTQHGYAAQLAALVTQQGGSAKVQDLAKRVLDADQPAVKQLGSWLTQWGSDVPATSGPIQGSTGAQHLDALKQAKGPDFDKLWLSTMIEQHKGELLLASTELSAGSNADAKALATRVASTEQAEIDEMTALLPH